MTGLIRSVSALAIAAGLATQPVVAQDKDQKIDEDLCSIFDIADLNDDARIHRAEYVEYFKEIPGLDLSAAAGPRYYGEDILDKQEAANRAFDNIDTNNDGFISVDEFADRAQSIDLSPYAEQVAEANRQEAERALEDLQEMDKRISLYDEKDDSISQRRLFNLLDQNSDGELTRSEIMSYVTIDTHGCDTSGLRKIKWVVKDEPDLRVFIENLDTNDDRRLTLQEYDDLMDQGTGE